MPRSAVVRNTLLPPGFVDKTLSLPKPSEAISLLHENLAKFQQIKDFASELQTEKQLIRPMLRALGYAFEVKPRFFEEHVKEPDFALFTSEEERLGASHLWGRDRYFSNVLALMAAKRYGRNLDEGITGFFLEFENRIPMYQMMYLLKRSKVGWGVVTNGRNWILLHRPSAAEKRLIEMDLEAALSEDTEEALALFVHLFSPRGLTSFIPGLIDSGRSDLIRFLERQKQSTNALLREETPKTEVYPKLVSLYSTIFPDRSLALTEGYLQEKAIRHAPGPHPPPPDVDSYDESEIFHYLLAKRDSTVCEPLDCEEILLGDGTEISSKEQLFELKILDMTPGFGVTAVQLVEGIAYLSLRLSYQEKKSFVAEWEHGPALYRSILDRMLFGTEKSHPALDILQHSLHSRFGATGRNYRLGNPLLGMSLRDIEGLTDAKSQVTLFSKPPHEILADFRDTYRRFFLLSNKIREDAKLKEELGAGLLRAAERIRDILDIVTAGYFIKFGDGKKIREFLYNLDAGEQTWEALRSNDWFVAARQLARRNNFFHMELEFPFLLNDKFDLIFIQPSLTYLWEDRVPLPEIGKAYIKRALSYLKQSGRIVLIIGQDSNDLLSEIKKAKKYRVEVRSSTAIIKRR
ncbi:MAG TPA: hypothetical protein DCR97_06625 [Deltaproteobacteria bacterium]|nr:hypothetical protein [Deltaproteobacteria bacterium]